MSDETKSENKPYIPLAIPERNSITLGFFNCQRAAGGSVRDCGCKLKGGGWLECPAEHRHVMPARGGIIPAGTQPPIILATPGVLLRRPDPEPIGDIEPEPRTPQQIAAAIAAERISFKRMQSREASAKGYTGNFCDHCGSSRMRHNGTCEVCEDCGNTGACG